MYITDKVSTDGWAHAWEDPSNKSYGEARRRMVFEIRDGPIERIRFRSDNANRPGKYISDEVTTHGRARTSNVISDDIANHERANRRKIVPVATNGQGLWDISDPIKSKQRASPWVVRKSNPMADCVAMLGEAKPRWKTCSLSIWRLLSQPVEVSTVAIVDDSKAVDHISGANSCYTVCQYMTARLHEEIVDGPRALPAISIPMQIACEAESHSGRHHTSISRMRVSDNLARSNDMEITRPTVVIDKEGSILLWYLPNAISQAYQVDLLNFGLLATLTLGSSQKFGILLDCSAFHFNGA
ncbi:hypothetical protein BKA82DRAFT_4018600 [Pisolithus tinctorius]|nr:hypothetical protein BKA82DRAFT_4018600 [Pisolithus tinctorius]